jgi:hypothetical protein
MSKGIDWSWRDPLLFDLVSASVPTRVIAVLLDTSERSIRCRRMRLQISGESANRKRRRIGSPVIWRPGLRYRRLRSDNLSRMVSLRTDAVLIRSDKLCAALGIA